ncbi:MAG: hypothetical protein AABM67_14395 [Acidobacteriota bacterium]
MRQQSERNRPDPREAETRPIELVTENGFAILRLWEIDGASPPPATTYIFLVRDSENREREIAVEIADDLFLQLELRTRGRVLSGNSYWICCAERHLATYLWETDDYPPGDRLSVNQLDPEDVMSAIRWQSG